MEHKNMNCQFKNCFSKVLLSHHFFPNKYKAFINMFINMLIKKYTNFELFAGPVM